MSEADYNTGWQAAQQYFDPEWDETKETSPPPSSWSYENTVKPRLQELMDRPSPTSNEERALAELRAMTAKNLDSLTVRDLRQFTSWFRTLDREMKAGNAPYEWKQGVAHSCEATIRVKALTDLLHNRDLTIGRMRADMSKIENITQRARGLS